MLTVPMLLSWIALRVVFRWCLRRQRVVPGLAPARVRHRRRNSRPRAWGVVGWWGGVPRYLLHRSSDRGWLVHTDRTQATQEPLNPSTPPLHHKDRSLCAPRRQPSKLNGGLGVFPIAETRQHERRRVLGGAWRQPKDKKRADDERGRDRNLLCMFASLWVQAREQLQSCRSLYYTPSPRESSQLSTRVAIPLRIHSGSPTAAPCWVSSRFLVPGPLDCPAPPSSDSCF